MEIRQAPNHLVEENIIRTSENIDRLPPVKGISASPSM